MNIDWSRIAQPQADGYDTAVILGQAFERRGLRKETPRPGQPAFCDGAVALARCPYELPGLVPAHFEHPNIAEAEALLKMWPAGYRAFREQCSVFWPMEREPRRPPNSRGVRSGHDWQGVDPMGVFVTVYDPQGCVEGLVHEIGHIRLASLGISVETHDGSLLLNGVDELYQSPVRSDILRPMCAVFHGEYAWAMLSEADLWIGKERPDDAAYYLARNVPKLEFGLQVMRTHGRYTPDGQAFFAAFYEWVESIIQRGKRLLASTHTEFVIEDARLKAGIGH